MKKLLCMLLALLPFTLISSMAEDAIAAHFAEEYPDAILLDVRPMVSDPDASICLFKTPEHNGVVIYHQEEDGSLTATDRNDTLFPALKDTYCLLSGWPEDDPELWYDISSVHPTISISASRMTASGS